MAGASPAMAVSSFKKSNTGEVALSGVVTGKPADADFDIWSGVVVGRLNSECPQQNRANESERGAHCQHIQPQGRVHGLCLPC
jgi:hypothetical protein